MGKAAHSRVGRLLSLGDLDGVQGRVCLNNARVKYAGRKGKNVAGASEGRMLPV